MPGGWRGGMSTTGIDLLLTSLTYVTGVKRYCSTFAINVINRGAGVEYICGSPCVQVLGRCGITAAICP